RDLVLMNVSLSARRRLIGFAGLVLALLVPFVAAVLAAPSAHAVPPICTIDCPPPPMVTYHSTITVTPPTLGTVHGVNDANSKTVDCAASDGSCTVTDSQVSDAGRPDD